MEGLLTVGDLPPSWSFRSSAVNMCPRPALRPLRFRFLLPPIRFRGNQRPRALTLRTAEPQTFVMLLARDAPTIQSDFPLKGTLRQPATFEWP